MRQDIPSMHRRKSIAGWAIALAAVLLLVNVREYVVNSHLGVMRALDLYPLDSAEMAGYDVARVSMLIFIAWVGYRLLTDNRSS
jgi:hypothetical protein